MSADTIIAAISGIVTALQALSAQRQAEDTTKDIAIGDLSRALRRTKMYIDNLNEKNDSMDYLPLKKSLRDWEQEFQLSQLWADAAISCRKIAPSISRMANQKSGFWQDVQKFTRTDVTRLGISILDAEAEIAKLRRLWNY